MNRNLNSILFAMIAWALSACGGGGGSGDISGNGDGSGNPRLNTLTVTEDNAADIVGQSFDLAEWILQLSQITATGVHELTRPRPLVETSLALGCNNDEGEQVVSYLDSDSSGGLSTGDTVEVLFNDCSLTDITGQLNDVLQLVLTDFSIESGGILQFSGEMSITNLTVEGTFPISSGYVDGAILIKGAYEIHYALNHLSETLTARADDEQYIETDLIGFSDAGFRDFSLTKDFSFILNQYEFSASGKMFNLFPGAFFDCRTEPAFTGTPRLPVPEKGNYFCIEEEDNSSVRLSANSGTDADTDGNGSYESSIVGTSLDSVSNGFVFSEATHYPKSLVVDFIPTLNVSPSSARSGKMAYDAANELLYISEFSGISVYDPNTGNFERDVIDTTGGEPTITLSADGSMIYLLGGTIKWYSLPDGAFQGAIFAGGDFYDLAVSPADPEIFAIAGGDGDNSLILYQDGTAFPNSLASENVDVRGITFNDAGDKIYAFTGDGRVIEIAVVADGVDVAQEIAVTKGLFSFSAGVGIEISYESGYIQFANGWRIDVAGERVVGQFGPPTGYSGVLIDSPENRAYTFFDFDTRNGVFYVYDLGTMRVLSRYQLLPAGVSNNLGFDFGSAVDMGANGIAVTIKVDNRNFVYVVDKSALADQDLALCTSQNFEGLIGENSLRQVYCEFKDIIYNAANNKLYATTPASLGQTGNSLLVINPDTGNIEQTLWLGSEPDKLALSEDNAILYVTLKEEASVLALDALTLGPFMLGTGDSRLWLGTNTADQVVIPTALAISPADSLAVSVTGAAFLGHYINGTRLAADYSGSHSMFQSLHFNQDGSILYGLREFSTWIDIFAVDGTGVNFVSQSPMEFLSTARVDVQGDYLLDRYGNIINLPGMTVTGILPDAPAIGFGVVMIDADNGHYYAYKYTSNAAHFIYRYDAVTLQPTARLEVSEFPRNSGSLIKLLNIEPQKIGMTWQKRLDIFDKADFIPCQLSENGNCE